jgi:CheY-like chemotaxis protein
MGGAATDEEDQGLQGVAVVPSGVAVGGSSPSPVPDRVCYSRKLVEGLIVDAAKEGVPNVECFLGRKPRVLLVDDQAIHFHAPRRAFNQMGFVTETAADGVLAVAQANASQFDIIVMDMKMPNLNGDLAIKQIVENPKHSETLIVGYSTDEGEETPGAMFEAGANIFLHKPAKGPGPWVAIAQIQFPQIVTRAE